jgi:hypothetical protein
VRTVSTPAELSAIIAEAGQRVRGRHPHDPRYLARLAEATNFLADVIEGRTSTFWLREAMSTAEFPLLMGDILDRQLLGKYQEFQPTYRNYCKIGSVRDFRTVRRLRTDGLEGRYNLTTASSGNRPELTPGIEDDALTESGYTYAVSVYEKQAAINWRMPVNDDLDAFRDIPDRLARGAPRSTSRRRCSWTPTARTPRCTRPATRTSSTRRTAPQPTTRRSRSRACRTA